MRLLHVVCRKFPSTVKRCHCGNLRTLQVRHGNQWAQPALWLPGG